MSLFDQINEKKAVFFEDYISFDDNSFSVILERIAKKLLPESAVKRYEELFDSFIRYLTTKSSFKSLVYSTGLLQ